MKHALLITSLFLFANSALAGGSTGGGNTLKSKLVEEYVHYDPSDIRGYDEYQEELKKLRKELPTLVDVIEKHMAQMDVYLIPAEIEALPSETTKLYFHTDQPVYQTKTEIFNSERQLERMDPKAIGRMFLHEGVMSVQEEKDAQYVRPVMVRLLSAKATVQDKQNALLKNGFSGHFSNDELNIITQQALTPNNILQGLRSSMGALATWCVKDESGKLPISRLEESQRYGYQFIGNETALTIALEETPSYDTKVCNGPLKSSFNQAVCDSQSRYIKYGEPGQKLNWEANDATSAEMKKRLSGAIHPTFKELAHSEAYITLLAIQSEYKADFVYQAPKNSSEASKHLAQKIMAKVKARRAAIDFSDKEALGRLHCNAIESVNNQVTKMSSRPVVEADPAGAISSGEKSTSTSTDAN